jgi:hypothetical protein
MTGLLERLRAALATDYDVEAEIAGGGMGRVFRARDIALDRPVAIKALRPEAASAALTERFLREARLLAGFRHPGIVPVHRAGEADGIPYYVMDLLAGETLAQRLRRGPLDEAATRRLGDDLLTALEAVHARGIVHRDVKPANIFLDGDRAILADFGIATSPAPTDDPLTAPGVPLGTPGYMAPEQVEGRDATARTDLYAAARCLVEGVTGKRTADGGSDWDLVPRRLVPVLQRGLAFAPEARWPDAATFRRALAATASPRPGQRWFVAALVVAVGALVLAEVVRHRLVAPERQRAGFTIALRSLEAEAALRPAADSLGVLLAGAVGAAPDFAFRRPGEEGAGDAAVALDGHLLREADSLRVRLTATGRGLQQPFGITEAADTARLGRLGDAVAKQLLLGIWRNASPDGDLPLGVLPRSADGLAALAAAESHWSRAQWSAAFAGYETALRLDATCTLCLLRLSDIARWLRMPQDPAWVAGYREPTAFAAFPPRYQALIAAGTDTLDRFRALAEVAHGFRGFTLAQFIYADEVFHRGPLAGIPRRQAEPFYRFTVQRTDFAPGWEHLAWLYIADGDSARATDALAWYVRTSAADPAAAVIGALLRAGFAWRFVPAPQAIAVTEGILQQPAIRDYPGLDEGVRYLLTFDAPEGVVYVAQRFAAWRRDPAMESAARTSALAALVSLGRLDSARAVAAALQRSGAGAEPALAAAGILALVAGFDSSAAARALAPEVRRMLEPYLAEGAAGPEARRRAAWLIAVAERGTGDPAAAQHARELIAGEPGPGPLATWLEAEAAARVAADPRRALDLTARLGTLDSAGRAGEPVFRAALHLARAEWRAATNNLVAAANELRWHENTDFVGRPATILQPAEADWALGALARWYRARILERQGLLNDEACRAYADVARLWSAGDHAFRARGDSARARLAVPACRRPT